MVTIQSSAVVAGHCAAVVTEKILFFVCNFIGHSMFSSGAYLGALSLDYSRNFYIGKCPIETYLFLPEL